MYIKQVAADESSKHCSINRFKKIFLITRQNLIRAFNRYTIALVMCKHIPKIFFYPYLESQFPSKLMYAITLNQTKKSLNAVLWTLTQTYLEKAWQRKCKTQPNMVPKTCETASWHCAVYSPGQGSGLLLSARQMDLLCEHEAAERWQGGSKSVRLKKDWHVRMNVEFRLARSRCCTETFPHTEHHGGAHARRSEIWLVGHNENK